MVATMLYLVLSARTGFIPFATNTKSCDGVFAISYPTDTAVLFPGSGRIAKMIIHLKLAPTFRIHGALPPCPLGYFLWLMGASRSIQRWDQCRQTCLT